MNSIPEWANWVARDKDGKLFAYEKKPYKVGNAWKFINVLGSYEEIQNASWLRFIKWEDKKPVKIVHHKDETKELIETISLHEYGGWHAGTGKDDSVNHPFHYNIGGIETIDIIKSMLTEEEFKGYLKGNILKYRESAGHKGNAEQDYAKAKKYYDWLEELESSDIETYYGGTNPND